MCKNLFNQLHKFLNAGWKAVYLVLKVMNSSIHHPITISNMKGII